MANFAISHCLQWTEDEHFSPGIGDRDRERGEAILVDNENSDINLTNETPR